MPTCPGEAENGEYMCCFWGSPSPQTVGGSRRYSSDKHIHARPRASTGMQQAKKTGGRPDTNRPRNHQSSPPHFECVDVRPTIISDASDLAASGLWHGGETTLINNRLLAPTTLCLRNSTTPTSAATRMMPFGTRPKGLRHRKQCSPPFLTPGASCTPTRQGAKTERGRVPWCNSRCSGRSTMGLAP